MAILIIEYRGGRQAGILNGRVLIGRWPENTVMIDHANVSRIHAWIGLKDGHYFIADAGSRTGTKVNGELLAERYFLKHNDEIRVGPATLHYLGEDHPPVGTAKIDLTPKSNAEMSRTRGGTFIDCVCGAPLWFPSNYTGIGKCVQCGQRVRPLIETFTPPPKKPPTYQPPKPQPDEVVSESPAPTLAQDDAFDSMLDDALTRLDPLALADHDEFARATEEPIAETPAGDSVDEAGELQPPAASDVEPPAVSEVEPPAASEVEPPVVSEVEPVDFADAGHPVTEQDDFGTDGEFDSMTFSDDEVAPVDEEPLEAGEAEQEVAPPEADPYPPDEEPALPPAKFTPAPAASAAPLRPEKERTCGVCHSTITLFDETAVCPACGLLFHADCWHENRGCSSYGCSQVNALEPNGHRV